MDEETRSVQTAFPMFTVFIEDILLSRSTSLSCSLHSDPPDDHRLANTDLEAPPLPFGPMADSPTEALCLPKKDDPLPDFPFG